MSVVPPTGTSTGPPLPLIPTINPGNGNFSYAGCYAEPASGGRALSTLWGDGSMTVDACLDRCGATANYIGVEYGRECWCGTTIRPQATLRPDKECGMTCKGWAGEYCGAGGRLNLYTRKPDGPVSTTTSTSTTSTTAAPTETSTGVPDLGSSTPVDPLTTSTTDPPQEPTSTTLTTTTTTAPLARHRRTIHPGTAGYTYIGCYTEATSGRALPGKLLATDTMTVPKCIEFCATNGFSHAGIEYARECWCGNSFGTGVELAPVQSSCNIVCKGDLSTYCGGSMRLNVYYKQPEAVAIPPPKPPIKNGKI